MAFNPRVFFRKAHRTEDRSTTVVLPPLYVGRRKEEYRWFEAGLHSLDFAFMRGRPVWDIVVLLLLARRGAPSRPGRHRGRGPRCRHARCRGQRHSAGRRAAAPRRGWWKLVAW